MSQLQMSAWAYHRTRSTKRARTIAAPSNPQGKPGACGPVPAAAAGAIVW